MHGELLQIIDTLSKEFHIEAYTSYGEVVMKTRMMINLILLSL